jgi:hypothetical protein
VIIPVIPQTAIFACITIIKKHQRFRFLKRGIKMKIFIGNLSYNVTENDLRQAFKVFGQVASATVIKDEQSGRSKGFGFVDRCASFPPCSAHAPYDDLHHYYNDSMTFYSMFSPTSLGYQRDSTDED